MLVHDWKSIAFTTLINALYEVADLRMMMPPALGLISGIIHSLYCEYPHPIEQIPTIFDIVIGVVICEDLQTSAFD
jgi:hypothetical protein